MKNFKILFLRKLIFINMKELQTEGEREVPFIHWLTTQNGQRLGVRLSKARRHFLQRLGPSSAASPRASAQNWTGSVTAGTLEPAPMWMLA